MVFSILDIFQGSELPHNISKILENNMDLHGPLEISSPTKKPTLPPRQTNKVISICYLFGHNSIKKEARINLFVN